jgi:tRNA pseudouridine(38-40) synthase
MENTSKQSSKRQVSKRQVMTFVMTTEYNGFAYAGFQRQSRTPTSSNEDITTTEKKRKRNHNINQELQPATNNKSGRKSNAVLTVQDRIEQALHKWTGLSLLTLRVRGAGRTDKGVSATHQVVAYDVPLSSVIDDEAKNNGEDRDGDTEISAHALPLLQEAYQTLVKHNLTRKETETNPFIDHWKIRRAISTRLPTDIVIRSIRIWNGSVPFEARQNVACKTYIYRLRFRCIAYETAKSKEGQANMHPICNAGPHLLRRLNDHNTVWLSPWPLDKDKIRLACEPFVGRHNFYNFVHKAERKESNGNSRPSLVRRRERYQQSTSNADEENGEDKYLMDLFEFNVHLQPEEEPDKTLPPIIDATFTLKAKGFHRSQVRNLVGFVVDVARGERSVDDAKVLLVESGDANDTKSLPTVNSAPASGLCLANVEYEHNEFL